MISLRRILVGVLVATLLSQAFASGSRNKNETTEVIGQGPNHRLIRRTVSETNALGQIAQRTFTYTELATGLLYQENGVWKESKEEIEVLPSGAGAVARQGRHKVHFAANLNVEGAIEMESSDGKRFRSHVLGLAFYDSKSGDSVMIAELQEATGQVVGNNVVLYPDAFSGLRVDVRYTYRRSGFEQDVILRELPPSPESLGMDPETTRLCVFTEFLDAPTPSRITRTVPGTALADEQLNFGATRIGRGKAFPLGRTGRQKAVPTGKSWIEANGRTFLIEEVEFRAVEKELKSLPRQASGRGNPDLRRFATTTGGGTAAQAKFCLASAFAKPAGRGVADWRSASQMLVVQNEPEAPGYVLDYVTLEDPVTGNFTFASGETYYLPGSFAVEGDAIFQAGTVVKFGADPYPEYGGWGMTLWVDGDVVGPASGKAYLTSYSDDSLGAIIAESTANPTNGCIYFELPWGTPQTLRNFHIRWASIGVWFSSSGIVQDTIFDLCSAGISGALDLSLTNVAFYDVGRCLNYADLWSDPLQVTAHIVQGQACGDFLYVDGYSSLSQLDVLLNSVCFPGGLGQDLTNFASQVNGAGGSFVWNYCDPNDTDADGMADAWEIQHFGSMSQGGGDDYDGDGYTNLHEYLNGSDPNTIRFTTRFENLFVSNRTIVGTCEILGGVPYQKTVLINDTNLASATWTAYSSNLNFTLPDADGDHVVLVALRGRVSTIPPVTDYTELTLDRVPPLLVITNPGLAGSAATVVKPYLQLQGYADEPLSHYSYDLTNEVGLVTNELVAVVDQYFDTNRFDFTTNYFQAYDLELATNVNTITLRVADRAGNVMETNITVTLDFTGDTTAPAMQLIWPTNGMHISGSSFYLRGKIDDETATLTARIIDANDVTNDVVGLVERNGMFWVEGLPLSAGTSSIELTATDTAGNVNTTSFNVVQSSVTLTMDYTPSGSDLYKPTGYVAGTVSDPDYEVTVNGVAAAVDEYGNWSAENVPNYGLGTSTFDVVATAPGNPAVTVSGTKEQPAEVLIAQHQSGWSVSSPGVSHTWTKAYQSRFEPDELGRMKPKFSGLAKHHVQTETGWYTDTYRWSDTNPDGTLEQTGTGGSSGPIPIPTADRWIQSVPEASQDHYEWDYTGHRWKYVHQYFAKGVKHVFPNGDGTETVVVASAKTSETLFTGGKAGSKKKNLFSLAVAATEYKGRPQGAPWYYTPGQPAGAGNGAGKVEVMGKAVGSDYRLYAVLPDNVQQDVTVNVKDAKHFSARVGATKHRLRIIVNGTCALEADKVVDCAKFSVGQKLIFSPTFDSPLPDEPVKIVKWKLAGEFINAFYVWKAPWAEQEPIWDESFYDFAWGLTGFRVENSWLQQETTRAWWLTGGFPYEQKSISLALNLTFPNGQQVVLVEKGVIDMHQPSIELLDYETGIPNGRINNGVLQCKLGDWGELDMGRQSMQVKCRSLANGFFGVTQLIQRDSSTPFDSFSDWRLDNSLPYGYQDFGNPDPSTGIRVSAYPFLDGPETIVGGYIHDKFKQYWQFRPNSQGSIWVTLGYSTWEWKAWIVDCLGCEGGWTWVEPPFCLPENCNLVPSSEHPEWLHRKINLP